MFGTIFSRHVQSGLHIPAMCHLRQKWYKFKVTVSERLENCQQE